MHRLGLVRDDETLHSQRLALWEEFNNCWLALLQSQKEKVVMVLRTGQHLRPEESTISQDSLEEMGKELVDLCDGMERYGLVDYQLGVWEEQIIAGKPSLMHASIISHELTIYSPYPMSRSTRQCERAICWMIQLTLIQISTTNI